MAPIRLYLDILDQIIDILYDEGVGKSKDALKACALVDPTRVARVQRHLFSEVTLTDRASCIKLASVISHSPYLATYVDRLNILYNETMPPEKSVFHENNHLVSIVSSVHQLQFLYLSLGFSLHSLHKPLRKALLSRFRTVKGLRCGGLDDFPMEYIISCTQLKDLAVSLVNMEADGPATFNTILATGDATPIDSNKFQLESLEVNHISCLLPLFSSSSRQCALKSLYAISLSYSRVLELLSDSQNTLQNLKIDGLRSKLPSNPLNIHLSKLQTLDFYAFVSKHPMAAQHRMLHFVASILEYSRPQVLTKLHCRFGTDMAGARMTAASDAWTRIDDTLSHPRHRLFVNLHVDFRLIYGAREWDQEVKCSIHKAVSQMLPKLGATERVNVTSVFT